MSNALKSGVERQRASTKYPAEYAQKVDISKVNISVIKKWIITELDRVLGRDDDVVVEFVCTNLENAAKTASKNPDIKQLQYLLKGFLESKTEDFCKELWKLLLSAQRSPQGIPVEMVEAKKAEMQNEKEDQRRAQEAARQQYAEETRRHGRSTDTYRPVRRSPEVRNRSRSSSRSPPPRRQRRRRSRSRSPSRRR